MVAIGRLFTGVDIDSDTFPVTGSRSKKNESGTAFTMFGDGAASTSGIEVLVVCPFSVGETADGIFGDTVVAICEFWVAPTVTALGSTNAISTFGDKWVSSLEVSLGFDWPQAVKKTANVPTIKSLNRTSPK